MEAKMIKLKISYLLLLLLSAGFIAKQMSPTDARGREERNVVRTTPSALPKLSLDTSGGGVAACVGSRSLEILRRNWRLYLFRGVLPAWWHEKESRISEDIRAVCSKSRSESTHQ